MAEFKPSEGIIKNLSAGLLENTNNGDNLNGQCSEFILNPSLLQIPQELIIENTCGIVIDGDVTTSSSSSQFFYLNGDKSGWLAGSSLDQISSSLLKSCIQKLTTKLIWHKNKMAERLVVDQHRSIQEKALAEPELPISLGEYLDIESIVPVFGSLEAKKTLVNTELTTIVTESDKILTMDFHSIKRPPSLYTPPLRNHARKSTNGSSIKRPIVDFKPDQETKSVVNLSNKENSNSDISVNELLLPVILESVPAEFYSSEFSFMPEHEERISGSSQKNLSICILCLEVRSLNQDLPCGDEFCTRCLSFVQKQILQICPICFVSLRGYFCKSASSSKNISNPEPKLKRIAIRSKSKYNPPLKIAAKLAPGPSLADLTS